jgi:TonB family protein
MKEHSVAVSVSLLFHIIIVALFLSVPYDQYVKPKLMVLDFSLEKGRTANNAEDVNHKSGIISRESEIGNRKSQIGRKLPQNGQLAEHRNTTTEKEDSMQRSLVAGPSDNLNTIASDPAGQVMVRGETGPLGAKADSVSGKNISVGEGSRNPSAVSGSMRIIDYSKGDSGANDFPFINETLQRRFKDSYPERARMMKWEGEVLLSFTILQNGTVSDIEIINNSRHSIFGDHTRDILRKTTFEKKLSNPIQVKNRRVIYQYPQ